MIQKKWKVNFSVQLPFKVNTLKSGHPDSCIARMHEFVPLKQKILPLTSGHLVNQDTFTKKLALI